MANRFHTDNPDLKVSVGDAPKTTPGVTTVEPPKSSPSSPAYPVIFPKIKVYEKAKGV